MSLFSVYINPPDYLGQWLRHDFWDSVTERVEFPRGSAPHVVLASLLRTPPADYRQEDASGMVPVKVPSFKGVNPASLCYLSQSGQAALIAACKKLFQSTLFSELKDLFGHDVRITDIIYDFMDRHGIEPTERNWETIRQMYCRMRKKSKLTVR